MTDVEWARIRSLQGTSVHDGQPCWLVRVDGDGVHVAGFCLGGQTRLGIEDRERALRAFADAILDPLHRDYLDRVLAAKRKSQSPPPAAKERDE